MLESLEVLGVLDVEHSEMVLQDLLNVQCQLTKVCDQHSNLEEGNITNSITILIVMVHN